MTSSFSPSTFNLHSNEASKWPAWFQEQQAEAWEKFSLLPQPSRQDELWRFANLKKASLDGFHRATPAADPTAIIMRSQGVADPAAKLIFANDRLIHAQTDDLPEGVILVSLEQAIYDHEQLFRQHFMKCKSRLGSLKFAYLHQAQLQTGTFLYLPPGVVLEKPIEVWHWVEGAHHAIFPHTLLVAGERSHASLIDRFCSVQEEPAFVCGMNDLIIEEEACLHYAAVQEWSAQTTAFHLNTTNVSKKGKATGLQLHLGGRFVRAENDSRLLGEEAQSIMLSINPAHAEQEIDQRTFQDHMAPRATSDLLYHNALSDHARTIFSGLIKVEHEAHQTDAYQKVRNLMLSDDAEANSMPGLEILADDVRCTHGATSGELNEEELFYMMARGIPDHMASKLIVRGFFQVVLDRLEEPELRSYLGTLLDQHLL